MFEPDRGSRPTASQFSGEHPQDIFASVVGALVATQKEFNKRSRQWQAFAAWYLDPNRDETMSKDDLAEEFGVKRRQLNRYLEQVMEHFHAELWERQLIDFLPENIECIH